MVSADWTVICFTELSRAHPDAPLFTENGIDVMTVKEFVRGFMGKAVEHQANTKLRKLSSLAYDTFTLFTVVNGDVIMCTG